MQKNRTSIAAEPGKQEYFITREFNAPRELVFKAFTEPDLVAQWLNPLRARHTHRRIRGKAGRHIPLCPFQEPG